MEAYACKTLHIQPDEPFAVGLGTLPVAVAEVMRPSRGILHTDDREDTLGGAAVAFEAFLSEIGPQGHRTRQEGVPAGTVHNHQP